jgi:hypothetical protein
MAIYKKIYLFSTIFRGFLVIFAVTAVTFRQIEKACDL